MVLKKSGLARAIGAEQRHTMTAVHFEIDVVQRGDTIIAHRQVLEVEDCARP